MIRTRPSALVLVVTVAATGLTAVSGPAFADSGLPVWETPAGKRPTIYLTFDDGPNSKYTPQVLAVLKRHGAKATFFHVGQNARRYPSLVRQIRAAGHTIGNHSVSHPRLTTLSTSRLRSEIRNGPRSRCFRPPYGLTNSRVRSEITRAGMRQMMWTIDTADYTRPGASVIANRVLSKARPGAIVLMHDSGGDRSQTVAALDRILRTLKARGYQFRAMSC
jgi:peptidoglycan-N-acetylglucosamine deacetylase